MTTVEDQRARRSVESTLTVLALTVVESRFARRLRRTKIGRELRATAPVDRALRALRDQYAKVTSLHDIVARSGATEQPRARETLRRVVGPTRTRPRAVAVTPFVILCQARTGSNLMQSELGRRWPEVRCLGEEYGPQLRPAHPGETTEDITARVFAATAEKPVVGCRLFYEHVTLEEFADILAVPGMKVVHLRRRNILRRHVSLQIALNNQVWARARRHAAPAIDERAVTIDVDRFIDDSIRGADRQARRIRVLKDAGVEVLDVWYEELTEHLDSELRRIAAFLGLGEPVSESQPFLVRQNPEPLRLLVRNYDELRRRLSRTSMRVFLDPEDAGPRRWIARPRHSRTCWPTEEQELLLGAALLPPDEAVDAFVQWRNVSNPYDIDDGSRRLYPMVHRNLRRAGVHTSLDDFMWDAYVQASGRNQKLLRTLEQVLGQLHEGDVPTLVLKGAALTLLHYRDRGARPMHDLDVMVPRELVGRALDVLRADGWDDMRTDSTRPIEELRLRHAVTLVRGDDELDVHWHALVACIDSDLDAEFWRASVEMEVGDRCTRALAPADQLLHAFAHGLRYNKLPPLRWIADAHVVITSSGSALDWDRLVQLADRYRLAACTSAALGYLDRLSPSLVPQESLAAAQALPVTRRERWEFEHSLRHDHWFLEYWHRYRRSEPERTAVGAVAGFAEELRVLYEVDHVWQLPPRALGGIHRRWRADPNGMGDERAD